MVLWARLREIRSLGHLSGIAYRRCYAAALIRSTCNSVPHSVFQLLKQMRNSLSLLILGLGLFISGCSTTRTQTSPAAWNELNSGMTREQIVRVAGQPSRCSSLGEDTWRKGKWELRVSYDERGQAVSIVRRLVIN